MIRRAWARWLRPNTCAQPCSVTTAECWKDVTGSVRRGTIVELSLRSCHERKRDHRVTARRVKGAGDEVGLAAEARVEAPVYVAGSGLV